MSLTPPRRYWLTGASSGIGAALAEEILKTGAHLAVSSRSVAPLKVLSQRYPGQVLVVSVEQIRNRRDELQQYINVLEEAVTIADAMTNEEGLALMMGRGLPRPAAAALWEERARSLRVDVGGLGVVASVRRDLQLLGETWTVNDLFDDSFAGRSGQTE